MIVRRYSGQRLKGINVVAERALVLGGGGVGAIAWETGVLTGLADEGVDVTTADFLVGTSAGATVAAQLSSGLPLSQLFARQADPARQTHELKPTRMSLTELTDTMLALRAEIEDPTQFRRRIGALALAADTVPESERLAVIQARLPVHVWPNRPLSVVAVNAYTGEPCMFTPDSGVGLVDAVAASCAVPGIWPPVTISGTRYIDGGVRSTTNADLAAGYSVVLVLAPLALVDTQLDSQVAQLVQNGSRVEVLIPDENSLTAFSVDPLDPETRTPAANAGRTQGLQATATITRLWK